jgi:hypothetical protein
MIEIFWIILILFLWFNTDALIQYSKVLGLNTKFHIDKWEQHRLSNPKISYLEYLSIKHKSFFTKLISCKPCLNFWITFFICVCFGTLVLFPVYYIIAYTLYKIIDKYV